MLRRAWFVPAVFFAVCWSLTTHGKYSVTGDEPHYLIVAESLLRDGDIDLRNNYAGEDSRRFGVDNLLVEGHAREARGGRYLTVHDTGVPIALLPIHAAATSLSRFVPETALRRFRLTPGLFAYSLISLFIISITAAAAGIAQRALVADGVEPPLASSAVLATWLSPPVLSNGFVVFPEPFALLVTSWALHVATRPALGRGAALAFALALGLLPWMHRKYAIYVAGLLVAVWVYRRGRPDALGWGGRAAALALFAAPQAALALWMWRQWGHVGGALALEGAPFSWDTLRIGTLGMLVDRENGLLVWGPIYLLLPVMWALDWRRNRAWLIPCAGLFFLSAAHHQWWAGFSPAGRFLMPLVPLFAFVGAPALREPAIRAAAILLLVPQALVSAYGWQRPRALWPIGDGHNRVLRALAPWLEALLPSLRLPPAAAARALAALAAAGAVNAGMWLTVRNRRRSDAD